MSKLYSLLAFFCFLLSSTSFAVCINQKAAIDVHYAYTSQTGAKASGKSMLLAEITKQGCATKKYDARVKGCNAGRTTLENRWHSSNYKKNLFQKICSKHNARYVTTSKTLAHCIVKKGLKKVQLRRDKSFGSGYKGFDCNSFKSRGS